jgi:transcription initiation factor TFIIF subunit alpha
MAPSTKAALGALLFHPKKKAQPKQEPSERRSRSPLKSNGTSKSSIKSLELEDNLKLPDGPYQEFRLMSSASHGWKYDVMKFDSRKSIDISTWQAPIKLNRKEPRRDEPNGSGAPEAVGPMLGSDGKPVIGSDGRIVMVDSEGRPIQPGSGEGSVNGNREARTKGSANGRKKFQKKSHQVFPVPDATRQLRREERYPWVIEDAEQKEVWVGKLEEVSKSETHAFFMPAADDVFKFVPAHRWYKFQKKPNYRIPNLEEAEKIVSTFYVLIGWILTTTYARWHKCRRIRIQNDGFCIIVTAKLLQRLRLLFSKAKLSLQQDHSFTAQDRV